MKPWFSLLLSFLVIANLLAIYYLDQSVERWFRFGATFIVLLIYLLKYLTRSRLLIIFLLLAICDALLVFYEIPPFKEIIYTVRILAYLNLILLVTPHLKKLRFNFFTLIIVLFVVSIDLYLLYEMANSLILNDNDYLFLFLFYLLGLMSLSLVGVCISYLNRYANKKAFLLVIVAFGFVMSDIFFYNAYYLDFEQFFYLDRLANILGLGALLFYGRELKKSKNGLKNKEPS